MSRPVVSEAAERLYERLRPYQQGDGDENGWVLLHLCEAAARTIANVTAAIRHDEAGSGWRRAYDPDRAPEFMLEWLEQHVGTTTPVGATEAQRRELIRDAPNWRRGTSGAMIAGGRQYLTGTRLLELFERTDGHAYRIGAASRTSETPDPDRVLAALLEQKPAGLILNYVVTDEWTVAELEAAYAGEELADVEGDYPTVNALEANTPGA